MIKVAKTPKSEKPRPNYRLIYSAGFINALRRYSSKQLRSDLYKAVYNGIKYIRLRGKLRKNTKPHLLNVAN